MWVEVTETAIQTYDGLYGTPEEHKRWYAERVAARPGCFSFYFLPSISLKFDGEIASTVARCYRVSGKSIKQEAYCIDTRFEKDITTAIHAGVSVRIILDEDRVLKNAGNTLNIVKKLLEH